MSLINHYAIRKAYPNVTTVDDEAGAFDSEGNQIELDQKLVDAAATEVAIEYTFKNLRYRRNKLLQETDWMANSDVTMSDEWRAYRQALRDLPANTTDPENPTWPTKPA